MTGFQELIDHFYRLIKDRALANGYWDDVFEISAPVAASAMASAMMLEDELIAKGIPFDQLEGFADCRQNAREALARWYLIDDSRVALVPLDQFGRDADLRRLV